MFCCCRVCDSYCVCTCLCSVYVGVQLCACDQVLVGEATGLCLTGPCIFAQCADSQSAGNLIRGPMATEQY